MGKGIHECQGLGTDSPLWGQPIHPLQSLRNGCHGEMFLLPARPGRMEPPWQLSFMGSNPYMALGQWEDMRGLQNPGCCWAAVISLLYQYQPPPCLLLMPSTHPSMAISELFPQTPKRSWCCPSGNLSPHFPVSRLHCPMEYPPALYSYLNLNQLTLVKI